MRRKKWRVCDVCSREFQSPEDLLRDETQTRVLNREIGMETYFHDSWRDPILHLVCADCCSELGY